MRKAAIVLAALSGIAALVVNLPLGWVAPHVLPDPLAKSLQFSGTVWDGAVADIPVFDNAQIKVNPRSRDADIQAGNGRNLLSVTAASNTVRDLRLVVTLADLPLTDARLAGLAGQMEASISEATYDRNGCIVVTGTATTDVLRRNGGQMNWTGPDLSGPIRCVDGAVVTELTGRDAAQNITATIRFAPDATYRADVTVQTNRNEADAVLPLFGFTRTGGVFKLTEQGRWR